MLPVLLCCCTNYRNGKCTKTGKNKNATTVFNERRQSKVVKHNNKTFIGLRRIWMAFKNDIILKRWLFIFTYILPTDMCCTHRTHVIYNNTEHKEQFNKRAVEFIDFVRLLCVRCWASANLHICCTSFVSFVVVTWLIENTIDNGLLTSNANAKRKTRSGVKRRRD